ncbi:hypothetical protein AAEX28_00970 [Lentisphaerota bacterium WC36G]|nr:hypothetical protein LJT99_03850 [Lentisphaerae bacterium WC36]
MKGKIFGKVVAIIIAILVLFSIGYRTIGRWTKKSVREQLEQICVEQSKNMPMKIDDQTIVTSIELGVGETLIYNYETRGINFEEIDLKVFKNELRKQLEHAYFNNKQFKPFRDNNVTLVFRYFTPEKKLITEVKVNKNTIVSK